MFGVPKILKDYLPPEGMTKEEQDYLLRNHKVTKGNHADNSWKKMQERAAAAEAAFGSEAANAKIAEAKKVQEANPSLLRRLSQSLSRSTPPPSQAPATTPPPSQAPATTPPPSQAPATTPALATTPPSPSPSPSPALAATTSQAPAAPAAAPSQAPATTPPPPPWSHSEERAWVPPPPKVTTPAAPLSPAATTSQTPTPSVATSGITSATTAPSQTPPPSAAAQAAATTSKTPSPAATTSKTPAAAPALDASAASQEPTGANLRERLEKFRDITLPGVKGKIKGDAVKVITRNDRRGSFGDSFNRPQENAQSRDDELLKQEKERKKKETNDKIEKIKNESLVKYAVLSTKYKAAAEIYEKSKNPDDKRALEKISAAIDVVYAETTSRLAEIQDEIDGGSVPMPIAVVKTLFNFVLNKIKIAINRRQLQNNALEIGETTMSALEKESKKIEANIDEGGEINISNLAELVNLAKQIADTNAPVIPPDAGVDPAAAAGLSPEDAAKAAAAAGLSPEDAAKAAAAAGTLPPGATSKPPSELPALQAPVLEAPAAAPADAPVAVAAGGGISRKRSDPRYISQISDNRSKIFKKELEIINSIRRFHRSHTIRKRDKINSILGLRKSRNSKSSVNSKNTRRHVHRNNNHNHKHKHKSTKHIKK
jgi:hypothetical protein